MVIGTMVVRALRSRRWAVGAGSLVGLVGSLLGLPVAASVVILVLVSVHPALGLVPVAVVVSVAFGLRRRLSHAGAVAVWLATWLMATGYAFLAATAALSRITGLGDPAAVQPSIAVAVVSLYIGGSACLGSATALLARAWFVIRSSSEPRS